MDIEHLIRGCLYGGLLGDAYGTPFSLRHTVDMSKIEEYINPILNESTEKNMRYSDGTEMALCICESLKRKNGFDASDLAQTFSLAYEKSPACRLYEGNMADLFYKMKLKKFDDPHAVAMELCDGMGYAGGEGCMRIIPVALYGLKLDQKEFNTLVLQITAITHTHPSALYGAVLLANAIRRVLLMSLNADSAPELDADSFIEQLSNDILTVNVTEFVSEKAKSEIDYSVSTMLAKLELVLKYVKETDVPAILDIIKDLGNRQDSLEVVPTALYVFLRSLKGIEDIKYKPLPILCSVYASHIAYDTDTIGSMACALAGARVGADLIDAKGKSKGTDNFPVKMLNNVEGLDAFNEYTNWFVQNYNAAGKP